MTSELIEYINNIPSHEKELLTEMIMDLMIEEIARAEERIHSIAERLADNL